MATIEFKDIAQLLNFSRTTRIEVVPLKSRDGRWSLYRGSYNVHTSSYPFRVLYLNAAATVEDVKTASREIIDTEETHVVYPASLDKLVQRRELASLLKKAKGVWTARDYLVSFIKEEVQAYSAKIADQAPRDYIDPRVETPSGFPIKTPNPLLSFLRDPQSEGTSGRLGILLAEPGQGKTYMSRYLVSRISDVDKRLVPLMVDSSQWHTMSVEDQRSLAKTIAHSFRHFGATIGWLEGHEDEFLRATLKADVFRIVFDGFDEYILRNRGAVQPVEVLDALANLANATGTRIVITSRTSFWNTNVPEADVESFMSRTGSFVFKILPFDLEHAKNYFKRRLNDPEKTSSAIKMYEILRPKNKAFIGRGFVLSLLADLAQQGGIEVFHGAEANRPMLWLLEALCQREVLRQELPFTAEDQMSILRTFAVEVAEGGLPNTELLELSMAVTRPSLDSMSLKSAVEKLKSHPLLEKDTNDDAWTFKQEQIRILLLADQIVKWSSERIKRFIAKSKLDPASWQDLASMIVGIISHEPTEDSALTKLQQVIRSMSPENDSDSGYLISGDDGSRLAGIVAIAAVEQFLPQGRSHQERGQLLLRLCGENTVRDLNFTGTIARYDFRGVVFGKCRFERVTWANCKFDEQTTFRQCQFTGGVPPVHCENFGSVRLDACILDPEAEAVFNRERVREGRKKYSVDDLRSDIDSVIHRFIIKGGIGLKTVESSTLLKGPISGSRYRDDIIEVIKNSVLEEHEISGGLTGFHIRDAASEAVKFYAANNVFTGVLREVFEKLQKKLGL
jgi:hypothetical protein